MEAKGEPVYYAPLPPDPSCCHHHHHHQQQQPPPPPQHYILLPLYRRPSPFAFLRRLLLCAAPLILLGLAIFLLWPSDPDLKVVRLRLNSFRIHPSTLSLDISMPLTIKVRNRDFFSLYYSSLVVSIGYRGKELGLVSSDGGHLRPRGSSYVDAVLQLHDIEIDDVVHLLGDLAKGFIPFETVTEVRGELGLFFFKFPLKAKVSCEVDVNTDNETIIRQNCYPE